MPPTKTVADVMTREVFCVFEGDTLNLVRETLALHPFHHLPVLDGERVVGMLSPRDVLWASMHGLESGRLTPARTEDFLHHTFARDIMCSRVATAHPDDDLRRALRRMLDARVGALPVIDAQGRLVGIVSENDLVRVVAQLAS